MKNLSRRHFLSVLGSGLASVTLTHEVKANSGREGAAQLISSSPKIKKYNPFGNTGMKVSDLSCGAISLFEPNVLRYAYECGINYFDTAETYMRTRSESLFGQVFKGIRDKIFISTKHAYESDQTLDKARIIQRIESSLKRLQTDYIDMAFVHNAEDLNVYLNNQEFLSAYTQMKKDGKIRFMGFSTHNAPLTLKQVLDTDFFQVVLFIYNHMEGKSIEPLIKKVRQKGIATIAMKVAAGGMQGKLKSLINQKTSYSQAAIRWVMSNPNIDSCLLTMSSYSHVDEYLSTSGKPLDKDDLKVISKYRRQANNLYCRVSCRECLASCPNRVAINDILRYAMYFESYGMEKEAIRYYGELKEHRKPLFCVDCSGYCETSCPYGLNIRNKLLHSHEMLSV